jgi:transcriptional regulator with XRE-family HTH domain/tetratricopeptide (TPR) repeat protein
MAQRSSQPASPAQMGFGALLRSLRERALQSQEQLAQRSGLSVRAIGAMEQGRVHNPRGESVRLLADALGLVGPERTRLEQAARPPRASSAGPNLELREPEPGLPEPAKGASVLRALAPCQLPPDVTDFTGRSEEVRSLVDLLVGTAAGESSSAVAVAAVAGKAGIGKTALAVHVAHQLRGYFPDGQLYINLRGAERQPLEATTVLARFLRTFGVDGSAVPQDREERAELYRARLADRRVLVVLDNAATEAQVRPLLPGTPGCAVLVTSRARLAGLEGAGLVDLDVLSSDAAGELLGRVAGAARVTAEPAAATAIVGYCGRLPLAIRIAGARLAARPQWSLARLAGLLADEHRRLDQLVAGDLEVRASLALSYQALTSNQQRALRLLGLLEAPDFAAWVAGPLLGIANQQAEELVDQLVSAQLLEVKGEDLTGVLRYRFHDLLRVYARERAAAEEGQDDKRQALGRVLGGWLALAEEADERSPGRLYGTDHGGAPRWPLAAATANNLLADPLAWFEAERVALVTEVEQAADAGFDELAWDLAGSLINFFGLRDYLDDWRHTHEAALTATRAVGNRRGEASLLRGLGYLGMDRNSMDVAMDYLMRALPLLREVGDQRGEAHAIEGIATIHRLQGRYGDAGAWLDLARTTFLAVGDTRGEVWTRFGIAVLHAEQGDLVSALEWFEETLATFCELDEQRGAAWTQRRLGMVHAAGGDLDRAARWLEHALAGLRQLGDHSTEAMTLVSLGELQLRRGEAGKARHQLDRCLTLARDLDDQLVQAQALRSLGDLDRLEERPKDAAYRLEQSAELWRSLNMPLELAKTLRRLEESYLDAGSLAAAESARREALALSNG